MQACGSYPYWLEPPANPQTWTEYGPDRYRECDAKNGCGPWFSTLRPNEIVERATPLSKEQEQAYYDAHRQYACQQGTITDPSLCNR